MCMRSFRMSDGGLKRHWLGLILAFAFVLMTLLTMQQQRVIEAQQSLIHVLARDSSAYWQVIAKHVRENPRKKARAAK
jgi:hypothetical protein